MIFIAHRGNTCGPDWANENKPEYIDKALEDGFHAEVDVWAGHMGLYLGHDSPMYKTDVSWLEDRSDYLFVHCKNTAALDLLLRHNLNVFWHEEDEHTITSWGLVWTYPMKETTDGGIQCEPSLEHAQEIQSHAGGVCSDYVHILRRDYERRE